MKKIVFFGDSVTDMCRNRELRANTFGYGSGYPLLLAGKLLTKYPKTFELVNRGVGGDRVVDLYARVKRDVWNEKPELLSILVGVNDVIHEPDCGNGVDLKRYEKVYRMLIEDTLERFPNLKIILAEPFYLEESLAFPFHDALRELTNYGAAVKKIAEDYGLWFLPLQQKFLKEANRVGAQTLLYDGIHPDAAGAALIAEEWLTLFEEKVKNTL